MLWVCRVGLPSPEPSRSRASALGRTSKPHTVTGRAGVELLQPSTALAGLALFALLYCALARLWSTRRSPLKQILDRHPLPHEEESRLQASPSCKALMLRGLILGITCAGTQRAMPSLKLPATHGEQDVVPAGQRWPVNATLWLRHLQSVINSLC